MKIHLTALVSPKNAVCSSLSLMYCMSGLFLITVGFYGCVHYRKTGILFIGALVFWVFFSQAWERHT